MIKKHSWGVKSKIKSLLLPQMVLILICLVKPIALFVVAKSDFDFGVLNPFAWNVWFLPVLFMCSFIYMLFAYLFDMTKGKNKALLFIVTIMFIPLSLFVNRYGYTGFLRCTQILPTAMLFYLLGNILKPYIIWIEQKRTIFMSIIAVIALCFCFIFSIENTPVMMYANNFGNYLLFMLCSILGIFFSIYISIFVKESKLLVYVGRMSIAFYVWQGVITALSLSIAHRIAVSVIEVNNTNAISLFAFSIAIIVLYNVVKFSTEKFPQIYGIRQ